MLQNLSSHWRSRSSKPVYIKEMAIGSAWILMGNGLARLLTLASSVIIARALGKESFGEYSLALNSLNILAEAVTFGAGTACAKYISESIHTNKAKVAQCIAVNFLITLLFSLTMIAILVGAKTTITHKIFLNEAIEPCLNAVAIGLLGAGINGTLNSILSGLKKFRIQASLNITSCIILFCLQALAVTTKSLVIITYATALGYSLICIITAIIVRKELMRADVPLQIKLKSSSLKLLYRYNLPAFLSGMTVAPTTWVANLLLARQIQGYEELAVYAVANQWRYILLFIPMTLASVALPILSGQVKPDANKLLFFSVGLNAGITFITCAAVYPWVSTILSAYGKAFATGYIAFTWMLFVVFLVAINSALSTYLTSQNRFWSGVAMNCLWALCFLGLCHWLIPTYKALGLIYAYVGSYGFHLIIQILQTVYIYDKKTHTHY